MCGIISFIGKRDAAKPLCIGLEALYNRGYDSMGVAILGEDGVLRVEKRPDKDLVAMRETLIARPHWGQLGIGHTRWATHGSPSVRNAHPHLSPSGRIAIVHNGMIDNFEELKERIDVGALVSETDTEVLCFLIERELTHVPVHSRTLTHAVRLALRQVVGAYAIAVVSADYPTELVVAASGSPLIIGTNDEHEWFAASEAHAFSTYARLAEPLADGELVTLRLGATPSIERIAEPATSRASDLRELEAEEASRDLCGHAHHMHREMCEVPVALRNTLRGRLGHGNGGVRIGALDESDTANRLRDAEHVTIVACGTSLYASEVGKRILERLTRLRVDVSNAAEWRHGAALLTARDAFIAVSQSGETKDVIDALAHARQRSALTFGITNRVGSRVARDARCGMYLHAGPEVAVASTKAFASQVAAFALLAAKLALLRKSSPLERITELCKALEALPEQASYVLTLEDAIKELALRYGQAACIPIIGHHFNAPVAAEGALKLQEVAYHTGAHGFAGSELKHGPLALVEKGVPVISIVPRDGARGDMLNNITEALARGADIIALTTGEDDEVVRRGSPERIHTLSLPETAEELYPVLNALTLQLFAYHVGVARGIDIDTPRNLAKTVTVK